MNMAYQAYRQTSIQTAAPDRLLIMLYDGLILALARAKTALETGDLASAHQQLIKAQDIVREGLVGPLDMQYDVAKSLANLYQYWHRRLVEANLNKQVDPVDEILAHARDFRETWIQVAAKARQEQEQAVTR
ncbi:MAG: flagellar export chaperone FliS [Alicyclobacillus sp.]|nr:flagellar export chaperone FliS [Alicyclobacillus sp.]